MTALEESIYKEIQHKLKTAPKGFDADHEAIDLLRYKQFLIIKRFTDEEVLSPIFLEQALAQVHN